MVMLFTKVKLYLEANSKTWEDEQDNIMLVNDGSGDEIKTWNVSGLAKPTDSQLNALTSDSDKEEKNNIVRVTRKKAYGEIGDQLDEIYKDIDAWKARIKKIKDDNPKS
tara:strand:- start:648 stop:974 length:327 start_codon:yes stop_codon:yes gene_type:complete